MPEIQISETIAASPEAVFDALTDLEGTADRIQGIESLEVLTEGPVGVGTRFRETRTMFGREATEEMEFSVFERPGRYVLVAESHGMRYETEHLVEAVDGGSRVTLRFQGEPQTTGAKIMSAMSGLFMGAARKAMQQDLADLKRSLEEGARDTP